MGAPLLSVQDLHVRYGLGRRGFEAVRGVSLEIRAGETVGLVGESGSGKTTLARAVLGLVPVTAGSISVAGQRVADAGRGGRKLLASTVQAVFQDPYSSLNPALKIGATLAEPYRAVRGGTAGDARKLAVEMLQRVGLEPDAVDRYPASFSGGQRQRIAVARALMASPQLVICDESVSALDLSVQAQVLNLLRSLQREYELSYLFIGHDLDVVRYMSHRIVVMYRGLVLEHGPADQVARRPRHPYTQALIASAPGRGAAPSASVRPAATAPGAGCPFQPRCRFAVARCAIEAPELRPLDTGGAAACHQLDEVPAPDGAGTQQQAAAPGASEEGARAHRADAKTPMRRDLNEK